MVTESPSASLAMAPPEDYRTARVAACVSMSFIPYHLLRWAQARDKGEEREGGTEREKEPKVCGILMVLVAVWLSQVCPYEVKHQA